MIDSYQFGKIIIDGKIYTSDIIIYPDRVEAGWWRREGHALHRDDISGIIASSRYPYRRDRDLGTHESPS